MKKLGKFMGFTLFGLLWLVVLLIQPEVYERYRLARVEKTNEWVLAYKDGQPWRDARTRTAGMNPYPDDSALPPPKPASDPALDVDPTVSRFLRLSEEDRHLMADVTERIHWLCDADAKALGAWSPERWKTFAQKMVGCAPLPETLCPDKKTAFAETLRKVAEDGKPAVLDVPISGLDPNYAMAWGVSVYKVQDAPGFAFMITASQVKDGLRLALDPAHRANTDPVLWRVPFQEYRPNVAVNPRFTTNNFGFRSADIAVPKPQDVYRIACIGGSTTEEGFTNATTYPAFLEAKLRAFFATDKIEVVNCGITGVDSLIERQRIFDYVALQPDLIIEYNGVNDICHAVFPLLRLNIPKHLDWLSKSRFYNKHLNNLQLPPDEELRTHIRNISIANLVEIARVCKVKNVTPAFATFACPDPAVLTPPERDYYEWNMYTYWQGSHVTFDNYCRVLGLYNDELKKMCEAQGYLLIPLAEHLKGGTEYFGDICHMRQLGIEAKAEAVFQLIKDHVAQKTGFSPGSP